ncbi:MAG: cell surface protein SprA, partial [Candidatus Kapaibacteriota bacterium]
LCHSYDLKVALSGGDIARILSQATGLTIPIPSNPIITIFGKPQVSLNVNGEVNIRVGWRWDLQNLGSTSAFGQSQSSPIFSQDIRVNVTGKIGDKLSIGTDWNTRRQFDFDNKFKLGYTGEDDDIIKLIEVGNVTMPVPSTLIGGGQALFGVRADFQFGPLFLKTIASQKRGERRFVDVRGGSSKQYFSLRAYDYAKNNFFLDTAYRNIYREYFKSATPVIPQSSSFYRIKEIEVYESTTDVRDNAFGGNAVAFADLEPKRMRRNELYPPSIKFTPIKTGVVERGTFLRIDS